MVKGGGGGGGLFGGGTFFPGRVGFVSTLVG